MFGTASEFFGANTFFGGAVTVTGADNGLSIDGGGLAVLGNNVGGTAGKLLSNREIPMNNFSILYSGMNNLANFIWKDDVVGPALYTKILGINSGGTEIFRLSYIFDPGGPEASYYFGANTGQLAAIFRNCIGGYQSFTSATTAQQCAMWGNVCAPVLTTGSNNDGIGRNCFQRLVSGDHNFCGGGSGLQNITTGQFNSTAGANGLAGIYSSGTNNLGAGFGAGDFIGMPGGIIINQATILGSNAFAVNNQGAGPNLVAVGYNIGNVNVNAGTGTTLIGGAIVMSGAGLNNTTVLGAAITISLQNVCVLGRADQNIILAQTIANTDNGSKLQVPGSVSYPLRTTAVNTTLTAADDTLILTAASLTIGIEAAASAVNRQHTICNKAGGSTLGTNYINDTGASTNNIPANTAIVLRSDGVNWEQIN
jgi:hypothetical protein